VFRARGGALFGFCHGPRLCFGRQSRSVVATVGPVLASVVRLQERRLPGIASAALLLPSRHTLPCCRLLGGRRLWSPDHRDCLTRVIGGSAPACRERRSSKGLGGRRRPAAHCAAGRRGTPTKYRLRAVPTARPYLPPRDSLFVWLSVTVAALPSALTTRVRPVLAGVCLASVEGGATGIVFPAGLCDRGKKREKNHGANWGDALAASTLRRVRLEPWAGSLETAGTPRAEPPCGPGRRRASVHCRCARGGFSETVACCRTRTLGARRV
jgi:hypothetical protein